MLIFPHGPQKPKLSPIFIIKFFNMSKPIKEQKNLTPVKKTSELPQVQKVVNQRYTNGKKQYKVTWARKPFEEATWMEEDKLNCPDKINEFLRRYEEVIKKKNLLTKKQADTPTPSSALKLQTLSKTEGKKISLEKPENGTQQKLVLNSSANLNKQKLQASLNKNNLNSPKKSPQVEAFKQSLNEIKPDISKHKGQSESQIENLSNPTISKIPNEKIAKSQRLTENDWKQMNGIEKGMTKQSKTTRKIEITEDFEEDTAETVERFPSQEPQQTFIDFTERLDIERICGVILSNDADCQKLSLSFEKMDEKDEIPRIFLVQNRFSDEQKLISRERMINEQPLKLIEYYESLLQECQQQRA